MAYRRRTLQEHLLNANQTRLSLHVSVARDKIVTRNRKQRNERNNTINIEESRINLNLRASDARDLARISLLRGMQMSRDRDQGERKGSLPLSFTPIGSRALLAAKLPSQADIAAN